jgi:hypothetical protein
MLDWDKRATWARVADPQTPLGFREMQPQNEMVNLWSMLGFVVDRPSVSSHQTEDFRRPLAK